MLLSIIMPVYNAENYLEKSLNSIINQTYMNVEIILINDGSTDSSAEICDRFAKRDSRIKVIHKINEGALKARKIGVDNSQGEFIGFVDADDYIELDYYERMIKAEEESNADIVVSNHYHDIGSDSAIVKNGISKGIYDLKEILEKLIYTGNFFEYGITPHMYTKIYRAKILKEIQKKVPDNIIAGDDAAITYSYICKVNRINVTDIVGYHYVQQKGSITKREYSNEISRVNSLVSFLTDIFIEDKIINYLEKQLLVYRNYLLALRKIKVFDNDNTILKPYGGLGENDNVVIYGAGVLGQKIYKYLFENKKVKIVAWVDKNYKVYQDNNLQVSEPTEVLKSNIQYDYIIIANITESVAISIKKYLLNMGVSIEKIKWFTKSFRGISKDCIIQSEYDKIGENI